MTDITKYSETPIPTDLPIMHHSEYANLDDIKIVIGKESAPNTLYVEWKKLLFNNYLQNTYFNDFPYLNNFYNIKKEQLLFTGIKNLRKNVRFLQLTKELASKMINDEQFEAEIEKNPDNFIIDIHPIDDPIDAVLLHDIVNKIGDDLTIDEVGDIFSFESESIKDHLNKLRK